MSIAPEEMCRSCRYEAYCMAAYQKDHWCGNHTHGSCIEIYDNVFIGGNSIIVGNVSIGPNAIIGAGSVVTKDVPEGAIVAGNPAKIVDSFSNLYEKRYNLEEGTSGWDPNLRDTELWEQFYYDKSERNKKKRK